jgi:hypothetical protein
VNRNICVAIFFVLAFCAVDAAARDIEDIAYEIAQKEMKPGDWAKYVKSAKSRYETWSNDNDGGSVKRYLDDKLVEQAPSALGGEIKNVKKMVFWVALYKEFGEPAHSRLRELAVTYEADLDDLMSNFSWEKAASIIKNRNKELSAAEQAEAKKRK